MVPSISSQSSESNKTADTKSAKQVDKANLVHQKKLEAMKKKYRARASLTANGAKSMSFTQDNRGKSLAYEEFKNIFSYLETAQHLTDLFGDGAKTSVGPAKMTKTKAFDVFAAWMNTLNPDLQLDGRRLQQCMATYKKRYTNTKNFEEHTGAGALDNQGPQALAGLLDGKCPCYSRMDAIFCKKPNVTPMLEFNHSHMSSRLPPIEHQNNGDGSNEEMALEETERKETLDPSLVLPPRLDFELEAVPSQSSTTPATSPICHLAPNASNTSATLINQTHQSISPSGDAPAEASIIHLARSQTNPSSQAANAPEPKSKMTLASRSVKPTTASSNS
ncbi:hypothetical protein PCASD_03428 [Puccinia coronata f. sp. avenae]|uniref:Uncharacterized protein n=1 Tax=Puccinia coronata f. sp. avenae TaxID=200324 RepID=A0A2N5VFH1_9BASI|nr:hypothetical protein PCASD_03428 [Puccinia coronata f. sp. avenae]